MVLADGPSSAWCAEELHPDPAQNHPTDFHLLARNSHGCGVQLVQGLEGGVDVWSTFDPALLAEVAGQRLGHQRRRRDLGVGGHFDHDD